MVSNGVIAGLAISCAISLLAPFAVYFALRRRMTLLWSNIGIGAAVFFIFALILEQVLHLVVFRANPGAQAWFKAHPLVFVAYGVLAAGVFEEAGRYLAMRRLVKPTGDSGAPTAYGLGHGGLECLLLGALNPAVALALLFAGRMPAAAVHNLQHLTVLTSLAGGFERLVALALQIALSFVVWRAARTGRPWFLLAAILLHAFADMGAGALQAGLFHNVWLAEAWAVAGLIATVAFLRLTQHAPNDDFALPPAPR